MSATLVWIITLLFVGGGLAAYLSTRPPSVASAKPRPRCFHHGAVEVESGGERVAWLCPDCDAQLPAEWLSPYHARPPRGPGGGSRSRTAAHCQHVPGTEITRLGSLRHEYLCSLCGAPYKGAWRSRDTAETARWEAEKEDTR